MEIRYLIEIINKLIMLQVTHGATDYTRNSLFIHLIDKSYYTD